MGKVKKKALRLELSDIEGNVSQIYKDIMLVPPYHNAYSTLDGLESRKLEILKIQETTWKLKIRVEWLKEGYLNTKFFHNCANGRRNMNSIWNIETTEGSMKHSIK